MFVFSQYSEFQVVFFHIQSSVFWTWATVSSERQLVGRGTPFEVDGLAENWICLGSFQQYQLHTCVDFQIHLKRALM